MAAKVSEGIHGQVMDDVTRELTKVRGLTPMRKIVFTSDLRRGFMFAASHIWLGYIPLAFLPFVWLLCMHDVTGNNNTLGVRSYVKTMSLEDSMFCGTTVLAYLLRLNTPLPPNLVRGLPVDDDAVAAAVHRFERIHDSRNMRCIAHVILGCSDATDFASLITSFKSDLFLVMFALFRLVMKGGPRPPAPEGISSFWWDFTPFQLFHTARCFAGDRVYRWAHRFGPLRTPKQMADLASLARFYPDRRVGPYVFAPRPPRFQVFEKYYGSPLAAWTVPGQANVAPVEDFRASLFCWYCPALHSVTSTEDRIRAVTMMRVHHRRVYGRAPDGGSVERVFELPVVPVELWLAILSFLPVQAMRYKTVYEC